MCIIQPFNVHSMVLNGFLSLLILHVFDYYYIGTILVNIFSLFMVQLGLFKL